MRGDERGFSIVEVIIAVLVLAAVASAVTLASVGGSKVRGAARLQATMSKAGQQAQEDLATDRRWMDNCSPSCRLEPFIEAESLKLDDVEGNAVVVDRDTVAVPVDSPADGERDDDRDGVVPDYFRITVVLVPEADVLQRYNIPEGKGERRFVTAIDRRGVVQKGSLVVEACYVTNQSDERMSIQGCAQGQSYVRMNGCPPTTASGAARAGCVPAWNWIQGAAQHPSRPSPFVSMRRVAPSSLGSFSLVPAVGAPIPSSAAKVVNGTLVFQNLDAGEYRIVNLPAAVAGMRSERWKTKEVPAYHGAAGNPSTRPTVAVEPGLKNRALVMYRPPSTRTGIRMTFDRRTTTRQIGGPFSTTEVAVPQWTPTDQYRGGGGWAYCQSMMRAQNAKQLDITHCDLHASPRPYCQYAHVRYQWRELTSEPWQDGEDYREFCTYYSETLTHSYYKVVGQSDRIRSGAAEAAVYDVEPKPDVRVVEDLQIPIETCEVRARQPRCLSSSVIRDLRPGLNTRIVALDGRLDGGSNPDNAAKNRAVRIQGASGLLATPGSGVDGMWVYPNGSITSSSGNTYGANPWIHQTGRGECYWRSPNYSGEVEGSCDPCTPTWTRGGSLTNACTILVRTCWRRDAIEEDRGTYGERWRLPSESGCFGYGPAWKCTSTPRVVGGGNCTAPSPPPSIPRTEHPTPGGGRGIARQVPVNAARTGA